MLRKLAMPLWVAPALVVIALVGCGSSPNGKGSGSSGPSSAKGILENPGVKGRVAGAHPELADPAKGILENLGVKDVTNPPPATVTTQTGSTLTVDPSTWQPLKHKYAVFTPQAEIFQAGGSPGQPGSPATPTSYGNGTNWNSFYENGASGYSMTAPLIKDDQSWEKSAAKISVAADLTGDGLDNIVVFYVNQSAKNQLNDIVYSRPNSGPGVGAFGATNVVPLSDLELNTTSGKTVYDRWISPLTAGIGTPWFPYFSCTKADLNGDGIDEIILVDYDTLYVLSVAPSGAVTVLNTITETSPVSSVAAGDYNGDGKDDFVVGLQGDRYILYNSDCTEVTSGSAGGIATSSVEATFGNFDAKKNGLKELALCAQASDGHIQVTMYDFTGANWGITEATSFEEAYNPFQPDALNQSFYRMLPRAVDINGDGQDELEVLGSIYKNPMIVSESQGIPKADYRIGLPDSGMASDTAAAPLYNTDCTAVDIQIGDTGSGGLAKKVTDPRQDLVMLSDGLDKVPDINIFGLNDSGGFVLKQTILWPLDTGALQSIDIAGTSTTIAVGNFENNSPRVKYVGHKLTFTNPIVIAALASPPYWSDIAQNDSAYANAYSGWNTTFGEEKANSTDTSTSVGFSVGAELKFQDGVSIFGVKIADFEASIAFTNTNTWEWEHSHEVKKAIQYNCPGGENLVIFTSVPMDQYEYQVVSTSDPTNSPVGSSLYIAIPRTFNTYVVTQAFFNSHIDPNIIQPISNSVFGNSNFTIGDPTTYPSDTQEQSLMNSSFLAQGWTDEAAYQYPAKPAAESTNNVSGGSTNLQIAMTNGTAETISHDFEFDTSVGGGAGGLSVLASAGFQTGYSTKSATSDTTTFGGTIGYLPESYYNNPKYQYSAGLFVYPYQQPNGTVFWVVNYDVTQP